MSLLSTEKLFPLPEAYERATSIRPAPSTCHRHRLNGLQGVRLETVKCGGKRRTSVEAVHRFNEAVTRAADGERHKPQVRTPRRRERDIDRADKELERHGI